ncbi:NAD(P)-dependent oxidoreductase [Adhaeribacter aerolatus]|uniref:dTDP-4-dehydrorhamnose reductase n=1 Tax=Adhaeribacter aerolatus TaxID=670289 RepID=A0A512AWM1_9BACT|nr:dTDP-4-dehydrorhamnose reductase [Adhaeribacter aerolatus]GEO04070.1 NAD(P)-dependent oxidoreductase [Adhaeribacter aerolatus]
MGNIIVFGASGQLGQCLQAVAPEKNIDNIYFLTKSEANILDNISLQATFQKYEPVYCINCAAYTAVDKAEDEPETARQLNRDAVENLSQYCRAFNTTLVHVSTDFVFSGTGYLPLTETDATEPINIYGLTKLEGEQIIPQYLTSYYILRTSWLYSEYGNNFVKTMLRFGRERPELKVIWDQVGTPTYAVDLARCILTIIKQGSQHYGIYHYSNEGLTSWYDFAKNIFELSKIPANVIPVRTAEYITKAVRPAYSVMDKAKIKQHLNIEVPYWRDSLAKCLEKLNN